MLPSMAGAESYWLSVGSSNNDPRIVASHFTHTISEGGLVPRFIRGDRGSENVVIAGIQRFFHRQNNDNGLSSFQFGTSVRNQRIEAWWSVFRRNRANFWINFFKDICDQQIYDPSIKWQLDLFRYCFIGLVQTELNETVELWNHHRIRKVRNAECPSGRPHMLYSLPNNYGGEECSTPMVVRDLNLAEEHVSPELFLTSISSRHFSIKLRVNVSCNNFSLLPSFKFDLKDFVYKSTALLRINVRGVY